MEDVHDRREDRRDRKHKGGKKKGGVKAEASSSPKQ
jgi:hypothetical protein